MKAKSIVKNVKKIIENDLMNCVDEYGYCLHHALFKGTPIYVFTVDANKALNQIDVFDAIRIVLDYEKLNFGGVAVTEIKPCELADMLVYIAGGSLLGKSKTLDKKWVSRLTKQDLLTIKKELKAYLRENPQDDLLSY